MEQDDVTKPVCEQTGIGYTEMHKGSYERKTNWNARRLVWADKPSRYKLNEKKVCMSKFLCFHARLHTDSCWGWVGRCLQQLSAPSAANPLLRGSISSRRQHRSMSRSCGAFTYVSVRASACKKARLSSSTMRCRRFLSPFSSQFC